MRRYLPVLRKDAESRRRTGVNTAANVKIVARLKSMVVVGWGCGGDGSVFADWLADGGGDAETGGWELLYAKAGGGQQAAI